jgi:hypothetical protein
VRVCRVQVAAHASCAALASALLHPPPKVTHGNQPTAHEPIHPTNPARCPGAPKAWLRAAQARIGLGPGQHEEAGRLLRTALGKAREQGAPTRGEWRRA